MVLLTAYRLLQKRDPDDDGQYRHFTALRAVGLSSELAWKLCKEKGPGKVTSSLLQEVRVTGPLKVQVEGSWRAAKQCRPRLRAQDSALALQLFRRQQAHLCNDLQMNIWSVDVRPDNSQNTCDLLWFSQPQGTSVWRIVYGSS